MGLYPSPDQYNDAVQNPQLAFFNPALKSGRVKCNALGLPLALGGTFALTYTVTAASKKYAVRCFHKEIRDLAARYGTIASGLRAAGGPYFVNFEFRLKGVLVGGRWFPTVEMDWADGSTLGLYVEAGHSDPTVIQALRESFIKLELFLRDKGIAHGDIQNGNVLFDKDLKLVDYDGVFVPGMSPGQGTELGHRNFQHPKRGAADFGPLMDRFSFILVDLSLRAMYDRPSLFQRYYDGENLIFTAIDLATPSTSPLFTELLGVSSLKRDVENFARICMADSRAIPSLEDFLQGRNIPAGSINLGQQKKAKAAPPTPAAFRANQPAKPTAGPQSVPLAVPFSPPVPPTTSPPSAPTAPVQVPPKPIPIGKITGWGVGGLTALAILSSLGGDGGSGTTGPGPSSTVEAGPTYTVQYFPSSQEYVTAPASGVDIINVRAGPGADYGDVDDLARGDRVTGTGTTTGTDGTTWISVTLANGVSGFVADRLLQLVAAEAQPVEQPSFSCAGDLNMVERTICSDAGLASKDREIAALYQQALDSTPLTEATEAQRAWLRERNDCGGSGDITACLNSTYDSRLASLRNPPTASLSIERTEAREAPRAPTDILPRNFNDQPRPRARYPDRYSPPVSTVTCILPSGEQAQLSRESCREQAGVIY